MTEAVAGRLAALLRMELIALRRAPAGSIMLVAVPLLAGVARAGAADGEGSAAAGVARMAMALALVMVLGLHHHLVTVYAARRQELVLKRLRAGVASDGEILVGTAAGTVTVFLGQAVVLAGYGVAVLGLPVPANLMVLVPAVLLAAALVAAASAALSAAARSSEAAMMVSVPTMVALLAVPGLLVPHGSLPAGVETAAWFLPLGPFPQLVRDAWLGTDAGPLTALPGLAVLTAWLVLAVLTVRSVFRWEPRRA